MSEERLNTLFDWMAKTGLDALALNPGPSLVYLTGLHFHLMERPTVLLVAPGKKPTLILPELEAAKALQADLPLDTVPFGDNPATWPAIFAQTGSRLDLSDKKLGVEPTQMRFLEIDLLQKAFPQTSIVSGEAALNSLRLCKDAGEIALMRKAAQIAQDALRDTLPLAKPGVTESELASELCIQLLRHGSEPEFPFFPIVASGPNSANPHAVPSDRRLQPGDLLLFDWGASYQGYFSDITRTFAIGELSENLREIYRVVLASNTAGREAGKPGLRAGAVDDASRGVIARADYGPYFTHRTGHGLGMQAHEAPYMFAENDQILREGMVYTVEPGIYLPEIGGVRIEDNLVVTAAGSISLTDFPRELTIL